MAHLTVGKPTLSCGRPSLSFFISTFSTRSLNSLKGCFLVRLSILVLVRWALAVEPRPPTPGATGAAGCRWLLLVSAHSTSGQAALTSGDKGDGGGATGRWYMTAKGARKHGQPPPPHTHPQELQAVSAQKLQSIQCHLVTNTCFFIDSIKAQQQLVAPVTHALHTR